MAPDVIAAIMRERARIRAWLHDSVLQVLETLAAGGYADRPDPGAMARTAAQAGDELRAEIEGELPPAPGDLIQEIHALVKRAREGAAHEICLQVGVIDGSSSGPGAGALVAAVSEALRNANKHANASRVTVSCEVVGGIATVVVADDGRGFDIATARRRAGLRHSIVGRLEHEGGRAVVDSAPGRGTRVVLALRLAPAEPRDSTRRTRA